MLKKFFTDLFTEKDNLTFDLVRVLGALSLVYFLVLATIDLFKECKDFQLTEVSCGITVILASIGASIAYKYGKEKRHK